MDPLTMTSALRIDEKLRASHVKRWHIVNTARRQTVAEHSFNVAIIADELGGRLLSKFGDEATVPPHITLSVWQANILHCALHHDLDEVFDGDTPSCAKSRRKWSRIDVPIMPMVVVKIADVLEAYCFIYRYHMDGHGRTVAKWMGDRVSEMLDAMVPHVEVVVRNLLDDIMREDVRVERT